MSGSKRRSHYSGHAFCGTAVQAIQYTQICMQLRFYRRAGLCSLQSSSKLFIPHGKYIYIFFLFFICKSYYVGTSCVYFVYLLLCTHT